MKTIEFEKTGGVVNIDLSPVLSTLRNGSYVLTVKRKAEKRSVDQNALMWAWFTCIETETGTPRQDVHDYYCRKFLRKTIRWNGRNEVIVEGTSKQTKQQMSMFLDNVQADAASEFGITLPTPEDEAWEAFFESYH